MKTFITLALVSVAGFGLGQNPFKLSGKPLPAMSMTLASGGKLPISTLRGKVVILDFWATWCAPCVAASPTMEKLYEKYKKKGLIVIGSNITDTPDKISGYAREHHYNYPFTQHNEAIAKSLGIAAIPLFIFIDRKGVVRKVDNGFDGTRPASWEKTVTQLLSG